MKIRPFLRVPDGRVFYGQWPQSLNESNSETPYIRSLAAQVAGVAEVTLVAGRVDVLNATTAFEVEPARSWRQGLRQAYGYAAMTGCAPALALFGSAPYKKLYKDVRDKMPGVQLWIWDERLSQWEHCSSNRVAARHDRSRPAKIRPELSSRAAEPAPLIAPPGGARSTPAGRAIDGPVKLARAAQLMRQAMSRRAAGANPDVDGSVVPTG